MSGFEHRDILDAMYALRLAFLRANLRVPAVLLESHDDGMRFMREMLADSAASVQIQNEMYRLVMAPDGEMWREFDYAGVKVRWPARQTALPDGGWEYA